jgi:predicted O-methyltransferase YrrM
MTDDPASEPGAPDRLARFLDLLAGPGQGQPLLDRLQDGREPVPSLLAEVAGSTAFADAYKRARVLDIRAQGFQRANPAAIGLADLPADMPFADAFAARYTSRLEHRAAGFGTLFNALARIAPSAPLIVETGTLRLAGNWAGDGQSTFLFDHFARERGGKVLSIDVSIESVDTARRVCSGHTSLICNDSVIALQTLGRLLSRKISLLYLDSFDLDPADPGPSAIHHALELAAAMPLLGPGSLVAVDDYALPGVAGGKGSIVDSYMQSIDAHVVYSGYQKVWQLR